MLNRLHRLLLTPWYWLAIVLVGLGLEVVALFYQHVLDEKEKKKEESKREREEKKKKKRRKKGG